MKIILYINRRDTADWYVILCLMFLCSELISRVSDKKSINTGYALFSNIFYFFVILIIGKEHVKYFRLGTGLFISIINIVVVDLI